MVAQLLRVAAGFAFVCLLTGAAAAGPVEPPSVVDTARARAYGGDTLGAIAELAPYVESHPDSVVAARLLGDLYFRVPNLRAAERVYRSILRTHDDDRETHNRLGGLYAAQDRVTDAIAEFTRSLPLREGFVGLVELHRRKGDFRAFERELADLADGNRFDAAAQANYANVLRITRRFAEARAYFAREYALHPHDCGAVNDLANADIDVGDIPAAITLLKGCLARVPDYYPALVNLGEAQIELGKYDDARVYLDRAVQANPNGAEALVDLGYLEDVASRWSGALDYYNRAIVVDPLARDAYVDLGYDYNEHRLYPLAEAAYLKGLSIVPNDGRLHYLLAVTYNLQGKIELARAQYRKALESDETLVVRAATADLALLPPVKR